MTERPTRESAPNMGDYAAARTGFRIAVPERFNFVLDVLEPLADRRGGDLALLSLDARGEVAARHSFSDLALASRRMAHLLRALGIGRGDRIFVMLPRIPEWYVVMLGAIRIGAVPLPGTPQLTARDIAYRVKHATAAMVVTDADGAAKVDAVRSELVTLREFLVVETGAEPGWKSLPGLLNRASAAPTEVSPTAASDPMLIYFTSGTVAHPKMVLHTQASYGIGHRITARYWQDLRPGDLHWTISDTGWAKAAWGKLFGQWSEGAAVVQMNMGKPDPDLLLAVIARHSITTFCAPPTIYRSLVLADLRREDLSRLRHCVAAGEPLNPEVIRVWEEAVGLPVYDGYGQTETINVVANFRCLPLRPGSMGKPVPGFDVDIVDEDGLRVGAGVEGNIGVRWRPERPVGLFAGYYRDESATEAAFRGDFYLTGDRGRRDEEGYLWFEGRSDDVITSSAYRIGPFEVESALLEHPAVAEAAVVGKPDRLRTEIVTAFVILAPGHYATADLARDLQEHVKRVTAPYKYPREIRFVTDLPKTVSGKIRRSELRQRLLAE
ncbi:MAG TPA: AMP-binding protein [Candidatus Dormibacteraeota bacterium]|nr:AMP-binding protein [Candidatus Dormibacteraeota bacterium]